MPDRPRRGRTPCPLGLRAGWRRDAVRIGTASACVTAAGNHPARSEVPASGNRRFRRLKRETHADVRSAQPAHLDSRQWDAAIGISRGARRCCPGRKGHEAGAIVAARRLGELGSPSSTSTTISACASQRRGCLGGARHQQPDHDHRVAHRVHRPETRRNATSSRVSFSSRCLCNHKNSLSSHENDHAETEKCKRRDPCAAGFQDAFPGNPRGSQARIEIDGLAWGSRAPRPFGCAGTRSRGASCSGDGGGSDQASRRSALHSGTQGSSHQGANRLTIHRPARHKCCCARSPRREGESENRNAREEDDRGGEARQAPREVGLDPGWRVRARGVPSREVRQARRTFDEAGDRDRPVEGATRRSEGEAQEGIQGIQKIQALDISHSKPLTTISPPPATL